jgi:bifunctional non-homologous end joining protein LigD
VQKHSARRIHYDFRLEHEGVLLSWAVPKGPSYDPDEKRLAVHVEDHPVEYADFEGVIPAGNYGAGPVIVWDKGSWEPLEDPGLGLQKGKLLFRLHGHKLHGEWTLVRTKKKGEGALSRDWLLIKHRDGYAGKDRPIPDESVLSGRTVEEVGSGRDRGEAIREMLAAARAPRHAVEDVSLMLAETRPTPFDDPAFLFELKYDGYRLLTRRDAGQVRLFYRGGGDVSALFPDLCTALAKLPGATAILDGEVAVLDGEHLPSFQRLQQRARLHRALDIAHAAVELPAIYYVFDLLAFDGFDLRPLPLTTRKAALKSLLPALGPLRYVDHVEATGTAFFEAVRARGLEGVVAKRKDAPYRSGRSSDWLKIRHERSADFAVVGYAPSDKRPFAGLHLAGLRDGRWSYAGRVGTGFSEAQLKSLKTALDARARKGSPLDPKGPQPDGRDHVWSEPAIVVEVAYRERTDDGQLRHPRLLRIRDDKAPQECTDETAPPIADPTPAAPEPIPASQRTVALSNRDKIFFPEDGKTKGDLIDYYEAIAPFMLPYLADRPLVLTRYPDGIHGKSFFQKDAPGYVPPWLRTERMWSEHAQREIDYFVADDVPSLLYVANLGTIPIHVWASRVRTLPTPDWCILDLDPKDAPFSHVLTLARAIKALCDELELPAYCKTTGSTGLHVLVPTGRLLSHDLSKTLGELLARVLCGEHPEIATIERVVGQRRGRVYVDFLQNGHGKTIVAPYSVRPLPGAPVSMPLRWSEVTSKLGPQQFTIANAVRRMQRLGEDPMRPVIDEAPRLERALERLTERLRAR